MKQFISLLASLYSLQAFGQEIKAVFKPILSESPYRIDSSFVNRYILNEKDTMYFPKLSTVFQCNYLEIFDRSHNNCRIFINGSPGNGIVEIDVADTENTTQKYNGTIADGYYLTGTYMISSAKNRVILTGQYVDNWKCGFWTSFYPNGQVEFIFKYIIGYDDAVVSWEFNENGDLINYTDEETEIRQLMKGKR